MNLLLDTPSVHTLLAEKKRLEAAIQADTADYDGRRLRPLHADDRQQVENDLASVQEYLNADIQARRTIAKS